MDYNGGNGIPPSFGGEQRRRTAGDRSAGTGEGEIRDWQRETWNGPAPAYGNPFDEPEDAPELRDSRSENVNEHLGDFWNQHTDGYQYTGREKSLGKVKTAGTGRRTGRRPEKKAQGASVLKRVLLVLVCLLLAVWAALRFTVFSLREIRIEGNQHISDEEILRISGMHTGDSLLRLDEKKVEERINADYRLQFRYLEKTLPSQATLKVREREACCWLTYGGILYTMDKNRMIMYETEDLDHLPAELVEVKGLKIRSGCRTGQTLTLNDAAQEALISSLFLEMKVLNCTALIREADLSSLSSLLMVTRDGYTVTLGDAANLHAKMRSLLLVREKLIEMEMSGGTINVVNPESPLYSPSST